MRLVALILSAWLLTCVSAPAQTPAAAPTRADQQLDKYLQRWEDEMQKIQTLAAQLKRTEKDVVFNTTQKFVGYAQYMKSGTGPTAVNLASLEMRQEGKNEIYEKFVCTGTFLYQFSPAKKEIKAHDLPRPKQGGAISDDNFLTLLFGVKAAEARKRYDLKLANEDQWYIYVSIRPRNPQDKADFEQARIVLNKDSYLPAQLWFEQPNHNEVTWEIPAIKSGVQVNRADFDKPTVPPGWKMTLVPHNDEAPTKIIRSGPGQ